MAGLKEIRRRIGSVKNTRQITRAMKLVSAAKLRRAQEAALSGRHFAERLEAAIATVLSDLPENFSHPFLTRGGSDLPRRVVVIAGERGLCGAYNTNLIKAAQQGDLTSPAEVVSVGRRAVSSAKRFGWNATGSFEGFPEDVSKWPIEEIVEAAVKDFDKVQEVVVYYTKFLSALSQKVTREVLVPLDRRELSARVEKRGGKIRQSSYSQDPVQIIQALVPLYVRAKIREAALESKASEHAARMTAMDSATSNASDLIDKLRLFYNRARQGAITKELLDIIGGAEAIE